MKFKIVTSPLDGEYNPVAQFEWLVKEGLVEPKKEYDEVENLKKNEILISAIEKLVKSLKKIDEETDPEKVAEIFDTFDESFEQLDYYTPESSDALINFLDILREKNDVLEQISDEIEFQERFITNYFELFSQPEIPRPVLWHIVNSYLKSDSFITSRDWENYMGHAITENPLSGDVIVLALLQHKVGQDNDIEDVPILGTNQLFWNPSVTIRTLERLASWYITDPDFGSSLDFLHYRSEDKLLNFDRYGDDFYITSGATYDLSIVDFAIVLGRLFDEIKLERIYKEDLALSLSVDFRTIAYFWTGMDPDSRSIAHKLGIKKINEVTLNFLREAISKPRLSAMNESLIEKEFPIPL